MLWREVDADRHVVVDLTKVDFLDSTGTGCCWVEIRQVSGEVLLRWEPPDPFDPSLDIHLGQQFITGEGRYAVVGYRLFEGERGGDVNGIIEVARIAAPE